MRREYFFGKIIVTALVLAMGATGAGADATVELANDQVAVQFSAATGAVTSIRNRAVGVDYTVDAPAASLFELAYLTGDTKRRLRKLVPEAGSLTGHAISREGGVQTLQLDYRVPGSDGGSVGVTCRASLADKASEVRWTIAVDNRAKEMEIVEVVFPILGGLRIGARAEDDFLTWPGWGGGRLIAHPQVNGKRSGSYAGGGATMAWMDLFTRPEAAAEGSDEPVCGLYFGSHDATLLMAGLSSQPSADGGSLTLTMKKYARVLPGQRWASAEFVTQTHAGDWHAGADAYRTWFTAWAPPPDPPQWLQQCDGRLEWTLPLDGTGRFEKDISEKVALGKKFGLNFARFGGQMIPSVAAGKHRCNRFPFPDPAMGSEEELAEVIKTVRRQGSHVAFYMNGQAWDPRWPQTPPEYAEKIPATVRIPDWEGGFKENALHHYDGTFYSQYKKSAGHWPDPAADGPYDCLFYFMCPASQGWQDHLHYWTVEKYVKQYGTDAMFLDQIGAESAKYCCNPAHGHAQHGVWTQAFMALAKRIKEDARRIDPKFTLETEGYGDAYGSYFDSFFIAPSSTGIWPDSHPEIARYTFPNHIFFDGFWRIQNPNQTRTAAETLNEVFLIGNRFLVYAMPEVLTQHTVDVVNLRRRIKHVLYGARFMDGLGTKVSDGRVRVNRFVLDEPTRKVTLLTIYNHDRIAGAKVDVDLGEFGPVREAAVAVLGGGVSDVQPVASGGRVSFEAPKETLSAVLLVHDGANVIEKARRAEQLPPLAAR